LITREFISYPRFALLDFYESRLFFHAKRGLTQALEKRRSVSTGTNCLDQSPQYNSNSSSVADFTHHANFEANIEGKGFTISIRGPSSLLSRIEEN
jgi:hypothetical protein